MRLSPLALGAVLALVAPTAAQVGRPIPANAELSDFRQTGARAMDDLVGRAVLIEFADWCPACQTSTDRLNQLEERYSARGLTVLGVTTQDRSSTERFLGEAGAHYGYAFDRSGALLRDLEIESFPTAVLVDPAGTVIWKGPTGELPDARVAASLEGAFKKPVWEWPRSTHGAVKALKKRQFGKALAALEDLDDPDAEEARAALRSIVRMRVGTLELARARGDWLAAERIAERISRELEGLSDEQSHAETFLDELRRDDEARRILKLQEKIEKLRTTRLGGRRDVERLIDRVVATRRQGAGTYAATQADELLRELRRGLR